MDTGHSPGGSPGGLERKPWSDRHTDRWERAGLGCGVARGLHAAFFPRDHLALGFATDVFSSLAPRVPGDTHSRGPQVGP